MRNIKTYEDYHDTASIDYFYNQFKAGDYVKLIPNQYSNSEEREDIFKIEFINTDTGFAMLTNAINGRNYGYASLRILDKSNDFDVDTRKYNL
jgi:hypothetical protein